MGATMELINLSKPSIGRFEVSRPLRATSLLRPSSNSLGHSCTAFYTEALTEAERIDNMIDNMKKLKFKVRLEGVPGMDTAALSAPFDAAEVFGTRARVPVRGTINGFPYRSSLMPMDGCHRMVVNREIRAGAGVKAGDTVTVEMERDDAQRTVAPAPQLNKELIKSKTAQANWE